MFAYLLTFCLVATSVTSLKCRICSDEQGFADANNANGLVFVKPDDYPWCTRGTHPGYKVLDCPGSCYNATFDNDFCT